MELYESVNLAVPPVPPGEIGVIIYTIANFEVGVNPGFLLWWESHSNVLLDYSAVASDSWRPAEPHSATRRSSSFSIEGEYAQTIVDHM